MNFVLSRFLMSEPTNPAASGRAWLRWPAVLLMAVSAAVSTPLMAQDKAAGDRTVIDWLTRMHDASRERAYTGTLVVSAGSTMSSSRIWHVCDGKQQMERVDTLTGEPRTTVRRNNEVITFAPESRLAWVEKRESLGLFPELLRMPSNQIANHYGARQRPAERIAGHLADVVDIAPKDEWRFGYRIWSEKKTGLVVKMQTLGEQGAVLEQVAFTELQLDAPVRMDKLEKLMRDTRGYEVYRPVLRKTTPQAQGWRLKETVPGFASMSCHTREAEAGTPAPMQWVFSDGLASVSLFVEPYDAARHQQEATAVMGATHSLTQRVGDYWLTAMGEVPPVTLRRFAAALERLR
jgi:sigma-E factor negative regulatory protein RseB